MRERKASLAGTGALSLLILVGGLSPAMALNCQTSAGTCYDTKTKEYRKCTTKVCTDDKGTVVSTETVLELQGGGGGTRKPKVPLPKAPATGGVKQ
jgi:hypothetical protein